ncbi:MAG: DNA translocase FtsK 4TM domain-containing protein, partial [Gemmataceae bacterium]|nr:DNA translocase FtsK 4TM domain-containing protein [Gemmataceae bacterium]
MPQESYCVEQQRLLPVAIEDRLAGWIARSAGAALCLAGLAIWLSLLTWSVNDPSLSHASFGPTRNLLGPTGAVVSDMLLQMLGLAAVFVALAPAVWGVELLSQGWIAAFRARSLLLILATVALAAGCSALPTAAAWPLHSGFGGVVGDLLYNLCAGLLAAAIPGRPGAVAGLVLFSGGLAAFIGCLGLEGRWASSFWQPDLAARQRPVRSGRRWSVRMPGVLRRRPHRDVHPTLEPELTPIPFRQPADPALWPDLGCGPASRAKPASAPGVRTAGADADAGARDPEFDASTDLESRRIAERFAPAGAHVPASPGAPAAPVVGGLLGSLSLRRGEAGFRRPGVNMLKRPAAGKPGPEFTQAVLRGTARLLEDVLADFGVKGEIKEIRPGPVVPLFELEPSRGTKSARVVGLAEDIARSMSATAVRVAVVPGRNVIGIELPNTRRETVLLR